MSDYPYTPFSFNVTPASPIFGVTPVASNASQGWVPSCSTPECVPTASWSTSSVGTALSFQFWGWDVAFDGNVKGNMTVELLRDGVKQTGDPSKDTLFRLHGGPTDQLYLHNFTLKVLDASPDAELTVTQARVNGTSYGDGYFDNSRWIVPSDDTKLSYTGFIQQSSVAQAGSQTTYMSSKAGDTVSTQFNGSALLIYGPCGPTNGLMKITIDGRESTVNTSTSMSSNDCLLFQSWGLPSPNMHQLLVENVDGASLGIDRMEFFRVHAFRNGKRNTGTALGVGIAIVVVFSALAGLVVAWKSFRKGGKGDRMFKIFCS